MLFVLTQTFSHLVECLHSYSAIIESVNEKKPSVLPSIHLYLLLDNISHVVQCVYLTLFAQYLFLIYSHTPKVRIKRHELQVTTNDH